MRKKRVYIRRFILLALICVALIVVGAVVFVNRYYPLQYTDIIYKYASEYDLKPDLICAVINAESSFDKDAVSGAGASGLMQIMESTAYWLAPKMKIEDFGYAEIFDPDVNIRFGCYYLNMLKKQYGDTDVALCAYNAGSGNVDKWLANPEYSGDGKTLDYIPFKETRDYVKKVSETQKIYSFILFFKAH